MANIFILTKMCHLFWWKCVRWTKSDLPITISVCEKVSFVINGCRKCYFLNFAFTFLQISNEFCQKSYNGIRGFLWNSTASQAFLIYTYLAVKRRSYSMFLKFTRKCIFFLYFSWKKNIAFDWWYYFTLCLSKFKFHKWAVFKLWPLNILFRFFRFLIYVYFNEDFFKNLRKKHYFLIQISKIHFLMQYITEY